MMIFLPGKLRVQLVSCSGGIYNVVSSSEFKTAPSRNRWHLVAFNMKMTTQITQNRKRIVQVVAL